jgi:ubiquinone/menaquinone biosynthesis C-methylase UbiE
MGTGQLTLPLAERFHEVIGVDHDAKMVGALEGQIAKGNIKLQVARAEDLSLPSNSVDLITIGNALHWWFDSLPAFWNSVASSLKPGGVVVVCRHKKAEIGAPDTAIDEFLLEKFDRGVLAPFIPPASKHHAQALSEIPFPFTDLPATQRFYYPSESGSQAINKADLFGFLNTWSASKRFLDANGAPPTDAIAADLSALWPDGELKTIRWEIEYRIGVRK